MRTTFNSSFLQSAADLSRTSVELARRQREVSSGRRLNTASDDPSAASGSVREHSEMAALDRYDQTADTANSRLSVADSVLSDMLDQLTNAKTTILAAQGSPVTDEPARRLRQGARGDSRFPLQRFHDDVQWHLSLLRAGRDSRAVSESREWNHLGVQRHDVCDRRGYRPSHVRDCVVQRGRHRSRVGRR